MRVVRIVIVVLVLIGFPLISWYYLSQGLKWRLDAQDQTEVKGTLPEFTLIGAGKDTLTNESLSGGYQVFALESRLNNLDHLYKIHEQFSVRPDYMTILIGSESVADSVLNKVVCMEACTALKDVLFQEDFSAAIVDSALEVRGRYDLSSVDDLKTLIKHLAVVLPITKRESLELIRNGGKQ